VPLFGAANPKPRTPQKSPGFFDKLEGVLNNQGASLSLNLPAKPRNDNSIAAPPRVMVGGADSMDHLLPKSP
jgi:hypothetical protein